MLASTALAAMPTVIVPGERDAEWVSYRNAYQGAAKQARYLRSRPLIQAHLQVRPRSPGASLDGLQLVLAGETTRVVIPVDPLGRAELPLIKSAYDEDAVLRLNRRAGLYRFSGRYSIKEREDGVYAAADLLGACEQLISAQRENGSRIRLLGKKCAAVTFIYPLTARDGAVQVRDRNGKVSDIPLREGDAFESQSPGRFMVATYRVDARALQDVVTTLARPLAIGTVYE